MRALASSLLIGLLCFGTVSLAHASAVSTGPNGIDSQGLGLTGNGVGIGQVEVDRPGDPSFDTNAALFHSSIDPAGVFYINVPVIGATTFNATADIQAETDDDGGHATQVAGVMISSSVPTAGVAPQADLFAGGNERGMFQTSPDIDAVTAQHIATRNGGNVHAINMSFGYPNLEGQGDATSVISSFVDWSADAHDVLYVVAGGQVGSERPVLSDNFNGITVAYSKQGTNQVFNQVGDNNVFISNPRSDRTYIDLLAPGQEIVVAGQGNSSTIRTGTSFAAPHVTGTVALLAEHANSQINNGTARWDSDALRHEVMKSVLMNSSDKVAGRIGMTRTIEKQNGDTWDDSAAAFDELIPLDEEMGAGHLNARRALQQYSSGEHDPDGAKVPVIGWDLGSTTGLGDFNKYVFNQELLAGSYISVTLAWDREVTFSDDGGTAGVFDSGDEFNGYDDSDADDVINDLDLYLMPKGATEFSEYVWTSRQDYMPLEHMFIDILTTDEYELWVH